MIKFHITPIKNTDGLRAGIEYPVYHIETEKIAVPYEHTLSKKKLKKLEQHNRDAEVQFDKDDEERLSHATPSVQETVVVWLLVGSKRMGKLVFVDSTKVRYLG